MGDNDNQQLWEHKFGLLKNVGLNLCLDANDLATPILYPCYPPGENLKQRYELNDNGWVQLPRSWADNGRQRNPALCLDTKPVTAVELHVVDCREVDSQARWERLWEEVPLETQLFRNATGKQQGGFLSRI